MDSRPRIAFVIDALPSLGGAEKVLFTALDVFPHADVFTLVYNRNVFEHTPVANRLVRTSFLDHMPWVHQRHRLFLPLMPFAVEHLDLRGYDLIVSFSYAVAHGVHGQMGSRHVSYTFTPMRYAWMDLNINGTHHRTNPVIHQFMKSFRTWDWHAAARVDQFAAISKAVGKRIAEAYGRDARIIFPPVEVDRFKPSPARANFYITVTRLVPHKRVDLLVQAFSQLKLPLLIVGDGPELMHLRRMAQPNIQFLGYQSDPKVAELMGEARGFVCATEEDFGIAMVEAQAAGCPVIAYGRGGALETVIDGSTGVFFSDQSVESLMDAVQRFERMHSTFMCSDLVANARRFDRGQFVAQFREFVQPSGTAA